MDDDEGQSPTCDHCGGDTRWEDCWQCGGEGGEYPHDYSPIEYDADEFHVCDICEGAGGYHVCANSREWCESHPLVAVKEG